MITYKLSQMKKYLLGIYFTLVSCNLSDATYELPGGYTYIEEGAYLNYVLKNNKLIIDHGVFGYSEDDNYLMFVYDTANMKNAPKFINNRELFYRVSYIQKDSLSKPMSYSNYKKFISKNKIEKDNDLSLGDYSKYSPYSAGR